MLPPPHSRARARRADIQGLRAVAVGAVILFHFFRDRVTGGFVGVDVFFVISGFLITSLLVREVGATGSISLLNFYGRRIRRLMPAALATTAATLVASALVEGPVRLVSILQDAAWTSAYLANLRFGMDPAGYFATTTPSPFLHYWSLAVEEQFYVLWPLLILLAIRVSRVRVLSRLPITLGLVTGVSLYLSISMTAAGSSHAYYSLATRAWELGLGGLVALLVERASREPSRGLTSAATTVGTIAILFATFRYTELTPFPGWRAAVPTIGAALIIWAGSYHRGIFEPLWRLRGVRFIGDSSYSLYLWHWPVLILGTTVAGESLRARLVLLALSLAFGFVSYLVIENRLTLRTKAWPVKRVVAVAAVATLVAVAVPSVGAAQVALTGGGSQQAVPTTTPVASVVLGRISLDPKPTPIVPRAVPANVTPSLDALKDDLADVFVNGCYAETLQVCEGGDPTGTTRIVLAGDSHAGQWWPAINAAAVRSHWKLFMVGKNGCALADVPVSIGSTSDPWPACTAWQKAATDAIVALHPDLIIYANHAQGYAAKVSMRSDFPTIWSSGVGRTLDALRAEAPVLMFGQSPIFPTDPATCLSAHLTDVAACSVPLDVAVHPDIRKLIETLAARPHVVYFDPTTLLCTTTCALVDQQTIMFRDTGHLSKTYSLSLADAMRSVVQSALRSHPG